MKKKIIIPCALGAILLILIISRIIGTDGGKILVEVPQQEETCAPDSIVLKVYMENSGSMNGYMCTGSTLKDAVFDYISDLSKKVKKTELNYINTKIISIQRPLDEYIKNLTPQSFSAAGGNLNNTDLPEMFKQMLSAHDENTVSIFISDCILDIPQNATHFFGACRVSIKNSFNEALERNPQMGVQILKMNSKFRGRWSCGPNHANLDTIRPYYIWAIGDNRILAKFNKDIPVEDIYKGIEERSSYVTEFHVNYSIPEKRFVTNHAGIIKVQVLATFNETLQSEQLIENIAQYSVSNPSQVEILSIQPITKKNSKFSHVMNLQLTNPETIRSVDIVFNYPYLSSWVESSNDDTGRNVMQHIDKTTGIKYLITGVAEAYKNSTACCHITFNLKNK